MGDEAEKSIDVQDIYGGLTMAIEDLSLEIYKLQRSSVWKDVADRVSGLIEVRRHLRFILDQVGKTNDPMD